MKEVGKYSTGVIIGVLLLVGFYFVEYKPSLKEAETKGYKSGLQECQQDTDTTYLQSEPIIEYRDTSFNTTNPSVVDKDSLYKSSFDTSYVSGKDTIEIESNTVFDIETGKTNWSFEIKHKDFMQLPDTIRITTPRYIDKVVVENNWLYNLISYVGGIATATILFLIGIF